MATFDGSAVSTPWFVVLTAARRNGVRFRLNSGRRSMAQQLALYRAYRAGRGNLAAFPSPFAPHIRVGRDDHALDVNALDGGAARLDAWCTERGFPLDHTVRNEPWHVELRGGHERLRTFARLIDAVVPGDPTVRRGSHGRAVKTLQVLLRRAGYLRPSWSAHTKYTLTVRRAVRAFQRKHRLTPDGVVGPATWRALRRATEGK